MNELNLKLLLIEKKNPYNTSANKLLTILLLSQSIPTMQRSIRIRNRLTSAG